jgi:hypothetical protein
LVSLVVSLPLAFLSAAPLARAEALGRGMRQLVDLYESANPKLATALRLHIAKPDGSVLVHVRLEPGTESGPVLAQLTKAGFRLQAVSELDPTLLEGFLPLSAVRGASGIHDVRRILAVQRPVALAGAVQSQAVALQKADRAQAKGFDGHGIRVAALSDTYDAIPGFHPNAADDVATGDLPAGVFVLEDLPPSPFNADEGRAMLQLIHDLAPGSQLGFATAFGGMVDFSNNILNLRRQFHADVIVDDVIYFAEPMYSDGCLAQTVDQVASEGAAYFSSAGNNGLEAYEAVYDPVSLADAKRLVAQGKENIDIDALAAHGLGARSFHNFRNPDGSTSITQSFRSYFGDIVDFQWDEPFDLGLVKTDYNIYVFDAAGKFLDPDDPTSPVFFTHDDNPNDTDEALEILAVNPGDYQIVLAKVNDGGAKHVKYVVVNGLGESARQNAPSIWGHAAARRGQAVAAMYYGITRFPEDYSSPGPTTIFFDKRGHRLDEPQVRRVPQITAADGVDTTFFIPGADIDGDGFPNFFGTSASAPDAAAVGALALQAAGGPGSLRPRELFEILQETATPVPLSKVRTFARAKAGPVEATANGDFSRQTDYWRLFVQSGTHSIHSVAIDLTVPDMNWSNPASPTLGFHLGETHGINPADVTATRSADLTTLTLTFAPGAFKAGDFLTFANFAFPIQLPVQFQVDADRVRRGRVTVTLDDGTERTGKFRTAPKEEINPFTGAGLVNAAKAVKAARHEDDDDDDDGHDHDHDHNDGDKDH